MSTGPGSMKPSSGCAPTVAERYLTLLRAHGVDTLFVNAGTDFAPLVEAYARNEVEGGPPLPTRRRLRPREPGRRHGPRLPTW